MAKVDWSQFAPVEPEKAAVDWSQFTPVAEAPKAEPSILDRVGDAMNAVRDFATGADKRESVLQGVKLADPNFDPAEAERLSRRAYAEQTVRDQRNLGAPSVTQAKKPLIALRDDGVMSRAADLVGAQVDSYSAGLGLKAGDALSALGAESAGEALRNKGLNLQDRADRAQLSVALNADGAVEKYAPQILAVFPTMAVAAATGGLPVMFGISEVQSYAEGRKAGLSPLESLGRAVPMGAAEVIGEKLGGTGKLIDALESATVKGLSTESLKNLGGKFLAAGAREVPSEEATYAMQFGIDKMPDIGLKQDATVDDFVEGAKDTAIVALGAGGVMAGAGAALSNIAGPAAPTYDPAALAREKGFLAALSAPKVEEQSTVPTAPVVQPKAAQAVDNIAKILAPAAGDPIAPTDDNALLARVPVEGADAQTPTADAGAAVAPAASADQPAGDGGSGQADGAPAPTVPNAVQPAAIPATNAATNATVSQTGSVPTAADPRTAALAKVEADLQAARARVEAEAKAAQAEAAKADAERRSVGTAYQQTSSTPTPLPGAAPSPALVGRLVQRAKDTFAKNSDLTDTNVYPEPVLYGIINSNDAGPDLMAATRQELGRRRGTNTQPTVSYAANFDPGTTSLGVGGQPAAPAGLSSVAPRQRGNATAPVGQAVGGQPLLAARPAQGGGAPTAGNPTELAPVAPPEVIAAASAQIRKDRRVQFTPYEGSVTAGQMVASAFANANGRTFTLVEQTQGAKNAMPNGFMIPGTNHVVVDKDASDAPVLVAVHEIYHGLPTQLRLKTNKALRALFNEGQASEFGREFNVTPEQFEEEIPAYMAQAVASRPTFWQELRTKMGNKDFSALASHILNKFKDLMRGAEAKLGEGFLQKYIGEESKILEAQRILTDAYVESMREQGLQPDAALVQMPVASNKPADTQEEQRQYKLEVDRADRATGAKASVSKAEVDAITGAAQNLGLDAKQAAALVESARETRKRFPPKAGWAPIEATGVEAKKDDEGNVKYDKKGNPQVSVTWKPIPYGFNVPPGKARAPAVMDTGLVGKVADQFTKLVQGIYTRAESGDKNAQIIVGHQTWYRNVAEILRREFGGQGDLFADLLGATSPNTPVDTNWRFAVEILTRFAKGEFDSEMEAFNKWVAEGGQPSKFPGEKIRQASGKLYGMNSKNSMLALADLWRAVEAGTAPKARNFALNLIGQSNMATIDVWAARMLRRAANNVRGMDLPRIPTVAEQGVTGNWNAGTTAVTGEFGFGVAVLDKVSADLAKKGIDLSPPDLQALAWFAEKELWTENNWTSLQGEGGSFEENIEANPTNRFIAGWSIQQGEKAPDPAAVSAAQVRVLAMLTGDPSVVAARVLPTYGLYGGVIEQSFDTEWTVAAGQHDPSMVLAEIAKLASENGQYDMFVSRVVGSRENNPNARPGVEIYFKTKRDLQAAMPVLLEFTSRGQDGFTMAVDPRAKGGENFIGVRLQYVPEISMRWDEGARKELMAPGGIEKALQEKEDALANIVRDVRKMDGVAYATMQSYDTVVVGKENYNEYIDGVSGTAGSQAGGRPWFGRPIRQGLEGAVARYEGERREDGAGSVSDAGGAIPFSNKATGDGLGGVYGERGQGARPHAVRIDGTHFSQQPRTNLDGRYFGRGLKGAEQKRLAETTDSRIKERVYFYVDEGKGLTPEAGVGGYAHTASVDNLYNTKGDPLKLFNATDINGSESRVLDAGFDGYYFPNYVNGQGIAIVLGNASRGIKVTQAEYTKGTAPAAPAQPYKRGLSSKELNTIDMAAVQEAAPSAKLRAGTFSVDEAELDAAREVLSGQGIDLPAAGPVFSNKANLDQDIVLEIPVEGGKTAKLTINAQVYINQLDAREDALRMVKECML